MVWLCPTVEGLININLLSLFDWKGLSQKECGVQEKEGIKISIYYYLTWKDFEPLTMLCP